MAKTALTDVVAQAVLDQTATFGLRRRDEDRLLLLRAVTSGDKVAVYPSGTTTKTENNAVADQLTLAARRAKAQNGLP